MELYKSTADKAPNLVTQENRTEILNGVEIKNEELKVLADATVHLTNRIIDCVEIFNKNGEMYPLQELQAYELTQLWLDTSQRRSIKKGKL